MHQRSISAKVNRITRKKCVISKRQFYGRVQASNLDLDGVYVFNDSNTESISLTNDECESSGSDNQSVLGNELNESDVFCNDLVPNNFSFKNLTVPSDTLCRYLTDFPDTLRKDLTDWATKRCVKRTELTHLLHILHPYHDYLPLDSRTLLKTPRQTATKSLKNGEYCHFGLIEGLKLKLMSVPNSILQYDVIYISFNIDGLPIFHEGHKLQL